MVLIRVFFLMWSIYIVSYIVCYVFCVSSLCSTNSEFELLVVIA
jgi:hypothetical protein